MARLTDAEQYEKLLNAPEFTRSFENLEKFKEWAKDGSILDLVEYIKICEKFELYEHCAIMKKLIDDTI